MKQLFTDLISSITDTGSYIRLSQKSLKASFGYFLFWQLILSATFGLVLVVNYLPEVRQTVQSFITILGSDEAQNLSLKVTKTAAEMEPNQTYAFANPKPNRIADSPILISYSPDATAAAALSTLHFTPTYFSVRFPNLDETLDFPWSVWETEALITAQNVRSHFEKVQSDLLGNPLKFSIPVVLILWFDFILANLLLIAGYLILFGIIGLFIPTPIPLKNLGSLAFHTSVLAQIVTLIAEGLFGVSVQGFISWVFVVLTAAALFAMRRPQGISKP